jgi:hypothetical protein
VQAFRATLEEVVEADLLVVSQLLALPFANFSIIFLMVDSFVADFGTNFITHLPKMATV